MALSTVVLVSSTSSQLTTWTILTQQWEDVSPSRQMQLQQAMAASLSLLTYRSLIILVLQAT
jgi:hypothetical protein